MNKNFYITTQYIIHQENLIWDMPIQVLLQISLHDLKDLKNIKFIFNRTDEHIKKLKRSQKEQ